LAILNCSPREDDNPHIFLGVKRGRGLSNMTMLNLLRGMVGNSFTVHGFRSSFRDWAAEQTNFSREAAEAALAHRIPDAVERAYRRGALLKKRRQMMGAWARYCDKPMATSKVLPLHRVAE